MTRGQPKKRTQGDTAARNWMTVLYPESLRDDFRDVIAEWHVPAFLSPLHDKDKDKDGNAKKPHYHLMVMYAGIKRYSQMGELFGTLAKAGHVEPKPCQDVRGMGRYLCHMDDPSKAQYAPENVTAFAGANYQEVTELPTDKERYVREMCNWCRDTGCISFSALMDEAAANHPDWHHALISNCTMVMFRYVRSLEDQHKRGGWEFLPDDPLLVAKAEQAKAREAEKASWPKLSPLEEAQKQVRDLKQRLKEAEYALSVLDKGE